jgi:membrane carboxypeptidase/penicillin-binding protein PbpC
MSEALVRSLNLPAVQVLEAYGPKRFAGMLSNAGLPLILPAGAQPNLSLILGAQAHGWRISLPRTAPLPDTVTREDCAYSLAIR